jgi:cytochrome b pre-mRNA-processing protein 3
MKAVAEELRKVTGRATETYTVYGVTESLFKECASQASYSIPQASDPDAEMPKTADGEDLGVGSGWWHTELGLKPTFSTWSQVTMLHMYILTTRMRCFPASSTTQTYLQHLLDHFFYDAENRMSVNHNMHARGTRNRYLKDLFIQWRGLLAAYDEGLMKGDAMLAAAVWRNVFKGDEEVDVRKVATVVSYLRRTLKGLEGVPDETVQMGEVVFGDPGREAALVRQKSPMMSLPFKDGKVVNEPVAT